MASHITTEQQKVYDDVRGYLLEIAKKQDTTRFFNARTNLQLIDKASKRIAELGKIAENSQLTTAQETERQFLYDNIKKIDAALGTLDPADQIGILSPSPTSTAEQDQRAAVIRETLKKQAEAANATQAASQQAAEIEEIDETNVEVARAAYQHYLLYNSDFFAEFHKKVLLETTAPNGGYQPITNDIIKTVGYVKSNPASAGGTPDEPRIFLLAENDDTAIVDNKLNFCPGNEKFADITPVEYAGLQPSIRIYKIYRNHNGSNADKKIEFVFRNRIEVQQGIINPTSVSYPVGNAFIDKIHTRGTEVGVKSFNWTFKGSDPFTATRDIEATLVLHAQSFLALSKMQQGDNLFNPNEKVDFKLLDLIIQPDCSKQASATNPQPFNNVYNPGCYEIQIDVGYAEQQGVLKDAICCQKSKLYLVHVDHKFDFKDDGTLDLTISYRGRLETIMKDKKFNVLLPGGGFFTETSGSSTIYEYNLKEQELQTERSQPTPSESRIKKLEREREAILFNLKQYTYASILETMEAQKMIHSTTLENDHFLRFARWKEPKFVGTLPDKLSIATLSSNRPTTTTGNSAAIGFQIVQTKDPETDAVKTALEELTSTTEGQIAQRLADAVSAKKHTINFVYFGDLLATVVANVFGEINVGTMNTGGDILKSWGDTLRLRYGETEQEFTSQNETLVGRPTEQTLYKQFIKNFHLILGNIKVIDEYGNSKQINLAHIPISLESYQDLMMKNVISQNIDYYSLTDFIDDIVGDLITDMFSGEHHTGLVEADSRVSISMHTSTASLTNSTPTPNQGIFKVLRSTPPNPKDPKYKVLDLSSINANNPPFGKGHKCADRQNDPYQYLVINTLNSYPKNLAGDYLGDQNRGDNIGDKNRGIMHFIYGRDSGLLKTVQFSKTDQEYLPEARFASSDGYLLNQLSSVYDATFNMIGNNLFMPGMLLYFNPELMGVGSPWQYRADSNGVVLQRSWSNIMGIGGYHLITEVAHSIAPGKFDTTVKARWVTSGQDNSP